MLHHYNAIIRLNIVTMLLSGAFCNNTFAMEPELSLLTDGKVKPILFQLFRELGYQGDKHLEHMSEYAQKNLLRKKGLERWDVTDTAERLSQITAVHNVSRSLGYFAEHSPILAVSYKHVLIMGASVARMHKRIDFFLRHVKQGLNYENLWILTGERPLDPFRENTWALDNAQIATEREAAVKLWQQRASQTNDSFALPEVVSVSMRGEHRPTTADTVNAWLKKNPQKGRILVISNNPYIAYQHAAVCLQLLKEKFLKANELQRITTVGSGTQAEQEKVGNLLDTIARTLYNEKQILQMIKEKQLP